MPYVIDIYIFWDDTSRPLVIITIWSYVENGTAGPGINLERRLKGQCCRMSQAAPLWKETRVTREMFCFGLLMMVQVVLC